MNPDLEIVTRVLVGFGLTFAVGFERDLRGASAGDRTFAIIGSAAAAVTAVAAGSAPTAISGVITGIGFVGAGIVFRPDSTGTVKGVTTAATLFACAAVGVVAGFGHFFSAIVLAALIVVALEARYLRVLRILDGEWWYQRRTKTSRVPPPDRRDET